MSAAWLTGYLTEEEMLEEHPLELEAIRRQRLEEDVRRAEAAVSATGAGTTPAGPAGAVSQGGQHEGPEPT